MFVALNVYPLLFFSFLFSLHFVIFLKVIYQVIDSVFSWNCTCCFWDGFALWINWADTRQAWAALWWIFLGYCSLKMLAPLKLTIGQQLPSSWLMPTCFVLLSKVLGEPFFPSQELGRNVLILVSAIIFIQMLQYLGDIPHRLRKQCSVKNMTLEYTWGWVS